MVIHALFFKGKALENKELRRKSDLRDVSFWTGLLAVIPGQPQAEPGMTAGGVLARHLGTSLAMTGRA
jgi:hypothetical protein